MQKIVTLTLLIILFITACFLVFSKGANDNVKGVTMLFGSITTGYEGAITWATVTTLAGSVAAIFLASGLVSNFSGKGLVPDVLIQAPEFVISIALGAAPTVYFATKIGLPVSTTHSLVCGLLNAKKVAIMVSEKVTPMNAGQGFTANLAIGLLVTTASIHRLPVSTTHVSIGSIFGIGAVTNKADTNVIRDIILSWILTVPLAAICSSLIFWIGYSFQSGTSSNITVEN